MDRVQELTERLEAVAGPEALGAAHELLAAVMDMYGEGLQRVMTVLDEGGEAAAPVRRALVDDGVVASLLLLHDLYPVDLETRVREALESVRPYMESHGGDVELLGITEDAIAQLRLVGHCKTCAASASTLELAIRNALEEHAPDLRGMDVAGLEAEPEPVGLVLPIVMAGPGSDLEAPGAGGRTTSPPPDLGGGGVALPMAPVGGVGPAWHDLADVPPDGRLSACAVDGHALVVGNVDGTLLAYRDECASCGSALGDAELQGPLLLCAACSTPFDLTRAGRSLDGTAQLAPVPLLRDGAAPARVALTA